MTTCVVNQSLYVIELLCVNVCILCSVCVLYISCVVMCVCSSVEEWLSEHWSLKSIINQSIMRKDFEQILCFDKIL